MATFAAGSEATDAAADARGWAHALAPTGSRSVTIDAGPPQYELTTSGTAFCWSVCVALVELRHNITFD
jgi:hypothetical protein